MAPQSTIEMQTCSAPPIEGEGEGGASPGSGVSGLNSLNLINGYSGTVTVVAPLGVGTFNLTAGPTGAIAQPSTPSGNDITVTGTFTWTGGVLNNTPSNAYVNIKGGGTITLPGTGNTLTSGSTLVFASLGGIQVTTITGAGTLLLNGTNEDAIFVRADAKVQLPVQEGSDGAVKGVDNVNKKLTIEAGAFWGYVGSGTGELGLQVGNNGGRFYLRGQVTMNMTGGGFAAVAYGQNSGNSNSAQLEIMNGCVLDASTTKGVAINGGTVWLIGNSDLGDQVQIATIKGTYTMTDGVISFLTPTLTANGTVAWGDFKVIGDVSWSGGQYYPGLNCRAGDPANISNRWIIIGTLTVDATMASKPTIGPVPQFLPAGQQASGTWDVIQATKVVGGTPRIIQGWILLPVVNADGVTTGFKVNK